jgi:isocitrate lyase
VSVYCWYAAPPGWSNTTRAVQCRHTRAPSIAQAEVGTGYFDDVSRVINPDSGTLALHGSTETEQFH